MTSHVVICVIEKTLDTFPLLTTFVWLRVCNVELVKVSNTQLSVCVFSAPDDFRVNPGAVEAVLQHPAQPEKVSTVYSSCPYALLLPTFYCNSIALILRHFLYSLFVIRFYFCNNLDGTK